MRLVLVALACALPAAVAWLPAAAPPRHFVPPRSGSQRCRIAAAETVLGRAAPTPDDDAAAAPEVAEPAASGEPAMVDGEVTTVSTPPDSFKTLVEQAADATAAALADGAMQMEVEFPPLPTSKLDDSSISAYDILTANLRLATEFHKRLLPKLSSVKTIALTLPDLPERKRAVELLGDEEPWPGLKAWSLVGGDANPNPFNFLSSVLKQGTAEPEIAEWADAYIVLGSTCQARRSSLSEGCPPSDPSRNRRAHSAKPRPTPVAGAPHPQPAARAPAQ